MARGKARGKGRTGPVRRPGPDEEANASAWLTTYGDAVTLLLAFFVMLFAMSSTDAAKFEQMAQSMRMAFAGSEGLLPDSTAVVGAEPSTPDPAPADPVTPTDTLPPAPAAPALAETLAEDIHAVLEDAGLLDIADVVVAADRVVVRVRTDDVLFATGSDEVQPLARRVVAALAPTLDELPNEVRVEGHTDDVPIGRGDYSNWHLSTDRAVAVVTLFTDEHGIDPARLAAVGFGEFEPLATNDTTDGRAANRRVEIVIETHPTSGGQS